MEKLEELKIEITPEMFKIHPSHSGDIMGVKGLGLTGEKYIKKWYLQKKYKRKPDWYSKFVEKGLLVEPIGIKMLSDHIGEELTKNERWYRDDFMIGQPDIIHNEIVFDIKSSWDLFTFPYFDKEIVNKDYYYQMQCYLSLTGLQKAILVYCLIDTPQPLIQQELKKLYFQSGGNAADWSPEVNTELAENYKFNDIPFADKIKLFEVERDEVVIQKIKDRVVECRNYLKGIL